MSEIWQKAFLGLPTTRRGDDARRGSQGPAVLNIHTQYALLHAGHRCCVTDVAMPRRLSSLYAFFCK